MTDFFVANFGSNSNNGSSGAPWMTWQHAINQIGGAIQGGDRILGYPGTYNTGGAHTIRINNIGSYVGNEIIIGAQDPCNPPTLTSTIFNDGTVFLNARGQGWEIAGLIFEDLIIEYPTQNDSGSGAFYLSGQGQGGTGNYQDGVHNAAGNGPGVHDILIRRCTFPTTTNKQGAGIQSFFTGTGIGVVDCDFQGELVGLHTKGGSAITHFGSKQFASDAAPYVFLAAGNRANGVRQVVISSGIGLNYITDGNFYIEDHQLLWSFTKPTLVYNNVVNQIGGAFISAGVNDSGTAPASASMWVFNNTIDGAGLRANSAGNGTANPRGNVITDFNSIRRKYVCSNAVKGYIAPQGVFGQLIENFGSGGTYYVDNNVLDNVVVGSGVELVQNTNNVLATVGWNSADYSAVAGGNLDNNAAACFGQSVPPVGFGCAGAGGSCAGGVAGACAKPATSNDIGAVQLGVAVECSLDPAAMVGEMCAGQSWSIDFDNYGMGPFTRDSNFFIDGAFDNATGVWSGLDAGPAGGTKTVTVTDGLGATCTITLTVANCTSTRPAQLVTCG